MRSIVVLSVTLLVGALRAQVDTATTAPIVSYGDTCITSCDVFPLYPGGEEALFAFVAEEVKYPKEAIDEWIEGVVHLTFLLEKDGSVSDVRVVRGVHPLLDAEAVRVLSLMQPWTPGYQRGKPVTVQYHMPVKFSLNSRPPKRIRQRRAELGW